MITKTVRRRLAIGAFSMAALGGSLAAVAPLASAQNITLNSSQWTAFKAAFKVDCEHNGGFFIDDGQQVTCIYTKGTVTGSVWCTPSQCGVETVRSPIAPIVGVIGGVGVNAPLDHTASTGADPA
jgi:hypothetical protein